MAVVESLTAAKIQELMTGWEGLTLSQEELSVLMSTLLANQDALDITMSEFLNSTMPQLLQDLANGDIALQDLNDNILPALQNDLDAANLQIQNLQTVELPALQQSLINEIEGNAARPIVYNQPDEPTNPDVNDRDLIVGDTWFDSDDNMVQRLWDGTQWSLMTIDTSEMTLQVKQLISSRHQIY